MASYNVRIYRNTGFNAVNIPDTPALLDQCDYKDVDPLQLLQQRWLGSIRVRATWADVKDADYCRVGSMYYAIDGVQMDAVDTATLSLIPDYFTSNGGVTNLEILDGVTERIHVSDDTFGKYCEDDPLMAPAEPLKVNIKWKNPEDNGTYKTYVETTIDLPKTASSSTGAKYIDDDGDKVTVPTAEYLPTDYQQTEYTLNGKSSESPKTTLYDLDSTYGEVYSVPAVQWAGQMAQRGIQRCRDLGIEAGIVNYFQVSDAYAEPTSVHLYGGSFSDGTPWYGETVEVMNGKTGTINSDISFRYTNAKNNRLNYGNFTPYGIITASGESCEFNAEDLIDAQNPNAPVIKYQADPRSDGKPYFRFRVVDSDDTETGFFRNCVAGLNWKQLPLVFNKTSGNLLNTMKYRNSRNVIDTSFFLNQGIEQRNFVSGLISGTANNAISGLSSLGGAAGGQANAVGSILGSASGIASTIVNAHMGKLALQMNQSDQNTMRLAQKKNELADYIAANNVAIPTINFPFNSELIRDFYGNGVMVYRLEYSQNDINRIDKLLTMYGYRHAKQLTKNDFTSRQHFNYVQCNNITIGKLPAWFANGIADQLRIGVRIWHKLPDKSYYTNNPVV